MARLLNSDANTAARRPSRTVFGAPSWLVFVVFALALVFGWGPNIGLLALSLFVLYIGAVVSWRPGEPAILLYCFGFQWLQASIAVLWANWQGINLVEVSWFIGSYAALEIATALTLIGLLVLMVSIRITAGPSDGRIAARAREQAMRRSPRQLAIAYMLWLSVSGVCAFLAQYAGGLAQPLLALAQIKYVVLLIIFHVAFVRGGAFRPVFFTVFAIELLLGLGGYFSHFSEVFVLTFIAALGVGFKTSRTKMVLIAGLISAALLMGSVWSHIKPAYRDYVNLGTGQQIVAVPWIDRMSKLGELALDVDADGLVDGVSQLAQRISYVEFFGHTYEYVPENVPHTGGALWLEALLHPLMPRILFPDKRSFHESEVTKRFAGVNVAGSDEGTSISIGYMAETYVDFGMIGMMLALMTFGLALGFVYKTLIRLPKLFGLISIYLPATVILALADLGTALAKTMGSMVVSLLVIWALYTFVPRHTRKLILGSFTRQ